MSYAKVHSAQTTLMNAHPIDIEVDILKGLHSFNVVGLADKAIEESRDRVSAAIKNSGFDNPKQKNQKIVIALAPAGIRKEGPNFDLAIALGYLLASNQVSFNAENKIFLGELALDGTLRAIKGILPLVKMAQEKGFTEVFVPQENACHAALIEGITIYPTHSLLEVIKHLSDDEEFTINPQEKTTIDYTDGLFKLDFSDVKGNESAKRGLIIAASGGHNITLYGPPGTGKTMLAKAFRSILPKLSFHEVLEVTGIHSLGTHLGEELITSPPFRCPHHTSSYVSMVGGGSFPRPGEVTYAHKGVLFLDEFPEFERRVLEALRQPLEDKVVSISRSKATALFPANFILLAAMNPCPCGYFGSERECVCTPISFERYKKKLSGPIMDRIDMWIEVAKVNHEKLGEKPEQHNEEGIQARKLVERTREIQLSRYKKHPNVTTNSDLGPRELLKIIQLSSEVKNLLNNASKKLNLSARSYHKIIKLARTIADVEEKDDIVEEHIMEALQYRQKALS